MADSGSASCASSSAGLGGCNAGAGSEALKLLSQGFVQYVRIDRREMLDSIMHTLGASVAPVLSVEELDDGSVKASLIINLSSLTNVNGECIDHSIVRSEATLNTSTAESIAIKKAFELLENNYRMSIDDYSHRVVNKLESSNTYDLFQQAFGALQSILVQWDLAFGSFSNFTVKLEHYEFDDHVRGPVTPIGKVYRILSEYMTVIQNSLHGKKKEILEGIEEVELDRRHYERRLAKKGKLFILHGPSNYVNVSSKWILNYVLGYYGLHAAKYTNSKDPCGMVKSTVGFTFPYMDGFKYGGNIEVEALGYTYVEAEEEAAFQALLFIEKHFLTKVVDYNTYKRKKAVKIQKTLVEMLAKTLELADSLKMMFGELINAVEAKIGQFGVDPGTLFLGPLAAGQIRAYKTCHEGLKEIDKQAVSCYGACANEFELLNKLSWKLLVFQSSDAFPQ